MFTSLPLLQWMSEPLKVTDLDNEPALVPAGADAIVVQALVQNVYIEYDNVDTSTMSFQIVAGLNPVIIRAHSGTWFKFSPVTAGAELVMRFARVIDRP